MSQRLAHASGVARKVAAAAVAVLGLAGAVATATADQRSFPSGLKALDTYKFSALESEVAGILPHPSNDDLFLVAANSHPAYTKGQRGVLPAKYRGRLLVVNRHSGEVTSSIALGGSNYGGMTYGDGVVFVSSLQPAEILKVDLSAGKVMGRFALSGPAGGLEFDGSRLLAQVYIGNPHLAVVDTKTGATVGSLWSDENAMDLARVSGDLLCTWASSFDKEARGELRRIDPATGKVTGRLPLPEVLTSMAALDRSVAGVDGFISLVKLDSATGRVGVRKYAYDRSVASW